MSLCTPILVSSFASVIFILLLFFNSSILLGPFLTFLLISLIDDGKNPDEFTRDVLNSCIAKNQSTKGKTDAFKVVFTSLWGILLKIYLYLFFSFILIPKIQENIY